ncbi:MAG TPA: hypothetical protein VEB88_06025, partial [Candidatus Acidoferrales bacterium]|nr:hypothetical protein [Candidatus Acidoferrales bacterium]
MPKAHGGLAIRRRQESPDGSEPLYAALNSVNLFLGNPFMRKMIRGVCANDKQAIYDALSTYSGQDNRSRWKRFKTFPVSAFIELGRLSFRVDRSKMQNYFSEQVARRGLSNVVKSIATYGISKPLRLQAPFLVVWNYTNACNLRCKHCYQGAGRTAKDE